MMMAKTATSQTTCTSTNQTLCTSAVPDNAIAFTANGTTIVNTVGTVFTLSGPNNTTYSATTTGFYRVTTAGCVALRFNLSTTGTVDNTSFVTVTTTSGTVLSCTIQQIVSGVACIQICNSILTVGTIVRIGINFNGNLNGGKTVTVSAFSLLNLEPALGPTPVTILNFNYQLKSCSVNLKWSTAQESNSKEFLVQNSTDGTTWSEIGKIRAQGVSGVKTDYSFIHPNPVNGQNFYRFAAVDLDGSAKYSEVLSPKINCGKAEISVHPNPFTDVVNVYFTSQRRGNVSISLRDNTGRTVYSSNRSVQSGSNTIMLNNLSQIPKGVYIISVKTDDAVINQKLIK